MIPRYSLPELAALWTDRARYETWTRVEVLACEAQAQLGVITPAELELIKRGTVPSPERVAELERIRDHEVLAFLAAFTETIPQDAGRLVHHGMTSYDLVDTALGSTLAASCDLIIDAARRLRDTLLRRADEHWQTPCVGRTHGVHAEPMSFGHKLAGHAFAIDRGLERMRSARAAVAVGTISGPVGTYASIDPYVERYVCERLGLAVEPMPTQVVARDRHAELLAAVALLGAVVERLAVELRLLQRTEVDEVEEPRTGGYQGSSAMPHKRNPTSCERLCGIARLLRANAMAAYENVALWHERDLAHSSVERIILPDSLIAVHYQVSAAADIVAGMRVSGDRMRRNLALTDGRIFSSAILLDLIGRGVDRDTAYRAVQAAAADAVNGGSPLPVALAERGFPVDARRFTVETFLGRQNVLRQRLDELMRVAEHTH